MPTLQLTLTDRQRRDVEARARELGFSSVEDYAQSLISADVELPLPEDLEAELLKSRKTPLREMTPADWDEKRRQLIEKHRQAKAG
jgi:hypothetical protein